MKLPTQPPEMVEAYAFVDALVPRADIVHPYPAWHGWALREAYLAGYRAAGARIAYLERELAKAMEAHEEP